ncbi:GumC family protein [Flavobacterium cheniae]|uniref:non-specific protein-tyrosine kinase n=1 Tax=Flavobacterium cheniae TaxID=295428 RepID=A0A562KPE5_9FLAO|nr:tyrosine-protein kinase [Flavobacterium cheniae]TDR22943.1 capsular exopolysaccharide synthesis family protein [Flavobacterium cheniae]TWH97197.1 capsular exopolysaccharide synthesis family protein [Flavobacterium cheniae]
MQHQIQNKTNFNFKEELVKYVSQWKWFAISFFICLSIAFAYLRYTVPTYKAVSNIMIKDERKSGIASELAAFSDISAISSAKSTVDNELYVLRSKSLVGKTILDLKLQYTYYGVGRILSGEMYGDLPFELTILNDSTQAPVNQYFSFFITPNKKSFAIEDEISGEVLSDQKYNFPFVFMGQKMIVKENQIHETELGKKVLVKVFPFDGLVESYYNRLQVTAADKYSSVLFLSFTDAVKGKAADFLDKLVENYNLDGVNDKKFVSENTLEFIENRLNLITQELSGVEKNLETFKKENKVTDIVSEAELYLGSASELEKAFAAKSTQVQVISTLQDYLKSTSLNDVLPTNLISGEASDQIASYNALVIQKQKMATSAGPQNKTIQQLEQKIKALQVTISTSLQQMKQQLTIELNGLRRQNNTMATRISKVPTQELEFRDINRRQTIKESLYLYLLQKREETAITLAVTAPNAKIIDRALVSNAPVSPNRQIIYLGSLFLGFLLPFSVIYLRDLVDTKIKSRLDFEKITSIPVIGEVPKLDSGNLITNDNLRSGTAEALRIIRTNLEFFFTNKPEGKGKKIFVTSTYPKEGKTFISVNLATILAQTDKKVLLMGLDIRNPKISEYITTPTKGITNYISSKEKVVLKDYIYPSGIAANFDVLPAGIIPPNPSELLMSKALENLLAEIEDIYDYIVVDTAPISLVTDTTLIAKYADAFLYVTRANYLDRRMIPYIEKLYSDQNLPSMSVLVNDTEVSTTYGYGYGYGYGTEEKSTPFWKKWLPK